MTRGPRSGRAEVELEVGREPEWHTVPLDGRPFDVINNVGTVLAGDGYGADRGYLERDHGQYETPESVFAWSGGAVLLTTRYLADVGLFDEQLFLYYEDVDLSWRGASADGDTGTCPSRSCGMCTRPRPSKGRRASTYNERNRLLTLTRHADRRTVAKALARYLLVTGSYTRRDVVSPLLRGQAPRSRPRPSPARLGGYAAVMVSRR